MQKLTAAILFGSVSSEYEVSLRSAVSVLTHIPREKYDVVMVGITKDGRWYHYEGGLEAIQADRWLQEGPVTPAILSPDRSAGGLTRFTPQGPQNLHIDVVFPVLHGERGEDFPVQQQADKRLSRSRGDAGGGAGVVMGKGGREGGTHPLAARCPPRRSPAGGCRGGRAAPRRAGRRGRRGRRAEAAGARRRGSPLRP